MTAKENPKIFARLSSDGGSDVLRDDVIRFVIMAQLKLHAVVFHEHCSARTTDRWRF